MHLSQSNQEGLIFECEMGLESFNYDYFMRKDWFYVSYGFMGIDLLCPAIARHTFHCNLKHSPAFPAIQNYKIFKINCLQSPLFEIAQLKQKIYCFCHFFKTVPAL